MIKIGKHIALPTNLKSGPQAAYPFADMEIGDSFWCSCKFESMGSVARKWEIRHGSPYKFTARKENDGSRVWRKA